MKNRIIAVLAMVAVALAAVVIGLLLKADHDKAQTEVVHPGTVDAGELTLRARPTAEAPWEETSIDCADEPDFCAEFAKPFHPMMGNSSMGVNCTMIYGGPEEANISGTVLGKPIMERSYSRTNGCEIAAWDGLQKLLNTLTPPVALPGGSEGATDAGA